MSHRPLILVLGILLVLGLGGNLLGQTIGAGREAGARGALVQAALNTAAAPAPAATLARQPQATATPCVGSPGSWRAEPPLTVARYAAAGAVLDSAWYVFGGTNGTGALASVERFDPATGTWVARAPLPTPETGTGAAAVGSHIYVPGGFNGINAGTLTGMQVYDPATDTWSQGAPLPAGRGGAGVAATGGQVYIIAGTGPGGGPTNTVYAYDPVSNTYTPRAPVPMMATNLAAAALNGRIYAIGGANNFVHHVYDPATDTWTTLAPGLTTSLQFPGLLALFNEIWAVGGDQGFTPPPPDQQIQIYTPAGDSWRFGPPLTTPRAGTTAAGVLGDRGYVAGGHDAGTQVFAAVDSIGYLPCGTVTAIPSATLTASATPTRTPTLTPSPSPTCSTQGGSGAWAVRAPIPTAAASIPLASDGRYVYAAGGSVGAQGFTNRFGRYDPVTDAWTLLPPVPYADDGMTAVYAPVTGKLYLFGGAGDSGFPSATRVYDPVLGMWSWGASMPEPRSSVSAAYWNGKIYVAGGFHLGANITFWVYDPVADTWAYLQSMPDYDAGAAAAAINGHFYLAGGFDGNQYLTTLYDYDIAQHTWATGPPLPVAMLAPGAAVVRGRFWVFGGWTGSGVAGAPALPGAPSDARTFIFDPVAGSWSAGPPLTSALHYVAGARAGSYTVAVGGTDGTTDSTLTQVIYDPEQVCPTATPTPCTAGQFSDVHPPDYFYTPVQYLVQHGVISGYGDCTFRPYNQTTRAQMVKIVVLGFNKPIVTPAGGGYTFTDVPPTQPFFAYIETAAAGSIVSGYACGGPGAPCDPQQRPYFRPYASVTRGQLSKIDVLAAGWPLGNPATGTFADVAPGSAFYQFVETAYCHGVISGYACGGPGEPCDSQNRPYFRPGNNAVRGQIAKIVYLSIGNTATCAAAGGARP